MEAHYKIVLVRNSQGSATCNLAAVRHLNGMYSYTAVWHCRKIWTKKKEGIEKRLSSVGSTQMKEAHHNKSQAMESLQSSGHGKRVDIRRC